MDGSSLERTSVRLSDTYSLWEPEDVVVVCLTEIHREWTTTLTVNESNRPVRKLNTALRNHMIHSLSYLKEISNLRALVVLDGFKDSSKANRSVTMPANLIYSNKGSLMEVAQGEIKDSNAINPPFNTITSGCRPTREHMSPVNHEILADKVLSAIELGARYQTIDLTEDFSVKSSIFEKKKFNFLLSFGKSMLTEQA